VRAPTAADLRRLLRGVPVAVLVAALLAVSVAGCGAPGSTSATRIEATEVPYGLLEPSVDPLVAGTDPDLPDPGPSTPVYLLGPDGTVLEPAPTAVTAGTPEQVAEQALARLEAGPTDAERDQGLASALGAAVGLSLEGIDDGTARVEVEITAGDLAADQVPLALGQVVLTLTAVEGIQRVQIVSAGEPVEMVLPGGRLTTEPVTAADYDVLTVPGAS